MKFTNPSIYDQLVFALEEGFCSNICDAFVHKDIYIYIFAKMCVYGILHVYCAFLVRSRTTP